MKRIKLMMLILVVLCLFLGLSSTKQLDASSPLINLVRNGQTVYHYNTTTPVTIPQTYVESDTEFRAVWVATVHQLNMPRHTSEAQYKLAFQDLIARVKAKNMNAIMFQVRPNNDAFYDSEYAPWSKWLTGTEGLDPGWNVMQYMVDYAHSQGIQFHAWLNPYRVQNSTANKTTMLATLHEDNFAKQNPQYVIAGNKDSSDVYPYILNPGEPAVKTYIRNVVKELMDLYDVDGIHFDDYFYPYGGLTSDTATYNTYKNPDQAIADWRRENVNDVIRGVMEDVVSHNTVNGKDVRFGVSPFGIWRSQGEGSNTAPGTSQSYSSQYADSKKWVDEGWLHYICPQIYWSFQHGTAPYADLVDWWASVVRGTDVDLIIGHGIHNVDLWLSDEIQQQLTYNQKHPEVKGSAFYSAAYLTKTQINAVAQTHWTTKPLNIWAESVVESPVVELTGTKAGSVYKSNVTATITSPHTIYIRINNGEWVLYDSPVIYQTEGVHTLHVKAVTNTSLESLVTGYSFEIDKDNLDTPVIQVNGQMVNTSYVTGATVSITSSNETIWYAVNHGNTGEWQLYTGPIVLDGTGNYYIRAKTINSENVESAEVNRSISVVAPCNPNPEIDILGTGNAPYYREVTVSINGLGSVLYRLNGGTWQTYTTTLSFPNEGTYVIEYKNNDACQVVQSETITVDRTPPDDPIYHIEGNFDGRYYTEVSTISLSKTDESDTIKYRLHNGRTWSTWATYVNPIVLTLNANYTIAYYAEDLAGNTSEVQETLIRLNIPPTEDNEHVERNGQLVNHYQTTTPVQLPKPYQEKEKEVRAVWVATVSNIDIELHTSEEQYKARIISILNRVQALNFNTVFFQVRPMNDAFYPSEFAPFSRYLTGTEGVDPGWDVLEFIIQEGHKRGIEIHAWLNPYRVSNTSGNKADQLAQLHPDNFARKNPSMVLQDSQGKLILNPGESQVRAYVQNVIQEIMRNYDIDGIHFDDYFYSYSGMDNAQDEITYNQTKLPDQSLPDWRRENVNTLVRDIFNSVESHNNTEGKHVKFGISPFGIWKSGGIDGSNTATSTMQSYRDQYADTKKWVEEGWLHYIMPQLYWQFDHSLAPYADLVDWWANLCEQHDVDLIIGHGFYRYAESNGWTYESEFLEQLRYNQKYEIIKGSALFSYKTLNNTNPLVVGALSRLSTTYWTDYVSFPWDSEVKPMEPVVCLPNQTEIDGECVNNPIVCEPHQDEVNGECVDKPVVCLPNQTEVDGECVDHLPTCSDDQEWNGEACIPKIPEVPDEPMNQVVVTALIIGGSLSGLGIIIFLVRKFVLKI